MATYWRVVRKKNGFMLRAKERQTDLKDGFHFGWFRYERDAELIAEARNSRAERENAPLWARDVARSLA